MGLDQTLQLIAMICSWWQSLGLILCLLPLILQLMLHQSARVYDLFPAMWSLIFSSCALISADCSFWQALAPIHLIKLLAYCCLYCFDSSIFLILVWLILASFSQAFTDSGCWSGCWALISHCSTLMWIKDSISLITPSLEMECPADLSLFNQSLSWLIWGWNSLFLPPPDALWCLLAFLFILFPLVPSWCLITKCSRMSCLAMMSLNLWIDA